MTYVVQSGPGSLCAIVDSVFDYDPKSVRTRHTSADRVVDWVRAHVLNVAWILETHAHADHLSAAPYLRAQLGGQIAIGSDITQVQQVFKGIFNLEPGSNTDGSQFDHLFREGDVIKLGELHGSVIEMPGPTPACVAYRFGDAVFVSDTLFMPDIGTARCDFPGGDTRAHDTSTRKRLYPRPETRLFRCQDHPPATGWWPSRAGSQSNVPTTFK